ncbi:unnamed protein product [Spodoptera exigua]|nr:unnamed protein product [Spodoptera exigua]
MSRLEPRPTRIVHLAFRYTKLNFILFYIYKTFSHVKLASTYKTKASIYPQAIEVVEQFKRTEDKCYLYKRVSDTRHR